MTRKGCVGWFGQRCARRQRRHRLSGGANAASPLPALAAGQVEVSEWASPSQQPCILPSWPGRGGSGDGLRSAAPLPLHPHALPGHHGEGKLLLNPTSAPPWDQGEDQDLLPRAETFTIAFRLAAEILPLSPLCSGEEGEAGARCQGRRRSSPAGCTGRVNMRGTRVLPGSSSSP